jgi:antitoxin (DNA-binding transcriptional repressor) of toxin-antitoxin stability system
MVYTVQHAQANLDRLLSEAGDGHEVVIEREGKPAVRLAVSEFADSTAKALSS